MTKRFIWPIGPWADDEQLRELGRWNLKNWEDGMEGWVMALLTRIHGVSFRSALELRGRPRGP